MKKTLLLIVGISIIFCHQRMFAQDNEYLNMTLEELFNLEIVTGSKRAEKLSEVPATVRVITKETIRKEGYLTLDEALSDLPGFQFRNIIGFNSYVFQRGLPSQNNLILVLVDGIQINELNSGGFYGGGQFNLSNVERIEVVYGPASVLYGTNAISGIINIITKEVENSEGLEAQILAGTFNTLNASLGYGHYNSEEDYGFRIASMFKKSEKADLGGAQGDNNWTENMENFENDYSLDAKAKYGNFHFGFNFQRKDASRSTSYKSIGTNYLDAGSSWNIQFLNSYLRYNKDFSENLLLQSQLYYRNATVLPSTINYVNTDKQVGYYRPNNLIGFESTLNYKLVENLHFTGGIVYEAESLSKGFGISQSTSSTQKPSEPETPQKINNDIISGYLQVNYKPLSNVSIYLGGRYDNSNYYGNVFTPRAAIVYNEGNFTGKILYTNAFRAPKPWDFSDGLGNPDLEPEIMQSIELIGMYNLGNTSLLSMSLYRNLLSDKISKRNLDNGYNWSNMGEWLTKGVEFTYDYKFTNFKGYLNYTYSYTVDENGTEVNEISRHTGNIGINASIVKNIDFGVRCNYLGKRNNPKIITSTGNSIIDPAFVVNASVEYKGIDKIIISFFVKNLFDEKYFHTSNTGIERYRQPQRTFSIQVGLSL